MADHHEYCSGGFLPDDIVISGISGRFPQCQSMDELNQTLLSEKDVLFENTERWKKGSADLDFGSAATIQDLDKFDAEFFNYCSNFANGSDPLMRKILEVSYEAIVDAGYEPMSELKGANIGVYTGVSTEDAKSMMLVDANLIRSFVTLGYTRCMYANQCSYHFDFHGPSYTVDTACSSSLVALCCAVQDVKEGRVEAALVNAGQLCLDPVLNSCYLGSGILSPTGECKPFDASANGLVRSEGIAALFIQKASQARRAYATILGITHTASGCTTEAIYVPSVTKEISMFTRMMTETGLTTSDIQYVESHGTGTQVGDVIEVKALDAVYCTEKDEPLYIGSVKSNLGHNEAAAGLTGIIKALLAFETGLIAPNRGFEVPNPNCEALLKGTIKVVTEPLPLTTPYIMANCFGFGGTIGQTVLKRNPIEYVSHPQPQELPKLVLWPGTTEAAIRFLFEYLENHPQLSDEFFSLLNKLSFCPPMLKPFRGYTIFRNVTPVVHVQNVLRENEREVWFVMTGMGCQWPGMGLDLMRIEVFAQSMLRSAAVLEPFGMDLLEMLGKEQKHLTTDRSITPAFVTIAAIQIALVDVLRTLDIYPDHVIGHSTGELLCAYVDGCCTAEETILSAYWRGRCVESAGLEIGAMAAVGLTWEEAVRRCPEGVYPACNNAEDSVTISGPMDALEMFVAELQADNVFARVVDVYGYAFHSKHVWTAAPALRVALANVIRDPRPRTERWISSSYPEEEWGTEDCKVAGVEYFVHNLMSPVRFNQVLKKVPSDAITIEIGPHFLLQSVLKRSIGSEATYIGLVKRNEDDGVGFLLDSLGKLYVEGLDPKIENLYRPVKFPVPRGTPFISDLMQWNHSQSWYVPVWKPNSTERYSFNIDFADIYLLDHFIDGRSIFPAAGYVYLAWQVLSKKLEKKSDDTNVVVESLKILRPVILNSTRKCTFEIRIRDMDGKFEIMENNLLVSSGRVYAVENMTFSESTPTIDRDSSKLVPGADIYNELRISGYEYGKEFRNLAETNFDGTEGVLDWKEKWIPYLDSALLFSALNKRMSEFLLPTGAVSFKICPRELNLAVEENKRYNMTGLPVNFHASTNICRAVGVEIQSLELDSVPQYIKPDNCVLEEYRFVPYMNEYSPSEKYEAFEKYMLACDKLIDKIPNKPDKTHEKFRLEHVANFDIDSYIKDLIGESPLKVNTEHLLLTTLIELGSSTPEQVQEKSLAYVNKMGKDFVNKILLNEHCLRLMFDIISENNFRALSVLEIQNNFSPVLPLVVETVERYSLLKFKSKHLVCENEDSEKEKTEECNIQISMPSNLPSLVRDSSQDIIISSICTDTKKKAREHVRLLSSAVKCKGFVLLFHKTRIMPPEKLLSSFSGQGIEAIPRASLESWFDEEHLIVVSKITDNVCSSLYLLRREADPGPRKIIHISPSAEWFDDLKSAIAEASATLWVVSEDFPDSGIIGMVNCLRYEPGGENIRCVFNLDQTDEKRHFSFDDPFYEDVLKKDLVMNVYKEGSWGSFRHSKIDKEIQKVTVDYSYANIKKCGDLSSFLWMESPLNYMHVQNRDLVHIYYSSLNFRDVMVATGKLTLPVTEEDTTFDNCKVGIEFSGRNTRGERVAGMCMSRGLATATEAIPDSVVTVPDNWSLEEAATVPIVYFTAYAALIIQGGLQHGESVLIHSGTGGVGQASIHIALNMNCEVYTTVGTEEKRQYLMEKFPGIKKENIGCSRDTSFENMILKRTNGEGVDLVLNSLADEKFQASIRCVGDYGRFIEIGKYDLLLNHKIGLKFFLRNITFHGVSLDHVLVKRPSIMKRVQELMNEGIRNGVVKPLDRTVFQRDEVEKAFRYMAGGTHVGKLLIKIRNEESEKVILPKTLRLPAVPMTFFHSRKVYIVIGGLGGFGIEVCKWLLEKGAKNIVVTSRYGARTPYHHFCLDRWRKQGYHVSVSTRNVIIEEEAAQLLSESSEIGPVGGIFNSALVLHDAFLENLDIQSFKEVCAPKADATRHLDVLSRQLCPELDHFVCFSSISCGRGNAGQMNYGYANSVMERICERRRAAGLPGLAIQWGIIGDVGVVHRHMGDDAMIAGICAQRVRSCLDILSVSCQLKRPVVCSYVLQNLTGKSGNRGGDVLQQMARVFGLKDASEFNTMRTFNEMGADSLMKVEIKHMLETACGTTFTVQELHEMKLDDVKALLEKAEEEQRKSAPKADALMSTVCAKLPKPFVHPEPIERLNDVQSGVPLFVLDAETHDLEEVRRLGASLERPAYVLLSTEGAPWADVPSLASWFLQKTREATEKEVDILARGSSSIVALEMVLQSQKSQNKVSKMAVLDGASSLLAVLNGCTRKRSEADIFSDFVECYIPSVGNSIREQLSNKGSFDQKLRFVVELFANNSKEEVKKAELSDVIASHIKRLQLLEDYKPGEKVDIDLLIIEDSFKLLANDVAEVRKILSEVCIGNITVQRVPGVNGFNGNSVQAIVAALNKV